MRDPTKEVYKIYKEKCEKIKASPVSEKEFAAIWNKGKDILLYMIRDGKGKEPYISIKIDNEFLLYQEVKKGDLVTNIWTKDQCEFLLGRRKMHG